MANWPGMRHQYPIQRWGGSVDWDDETQIPNGVGIVVKNNRFRAESPATRYGRKHSMTYAATGGVTGLDCLNVLVDNPQQIPILFTDSGLLLQESPAGSGTLVPVSPPLVLPTEAYMQDTLAYNRMYMAFGNGTEGLCPPIVFDGPSGVTSIIGQNPTGALWAQNTLYQVGDLVRASDGRWWRCTSASKAESVATPPQWPQFNGYFQSLEGWVPATATDPVGESQWEEWTPNCVQFLPAPGVVSANVTDSPGSGTIASGKDVYIKISFICPQSGESPQSAAMVFVDTGANDQLTVTFAGGAGASPNMRRWIAEINLQPSYFYPILLNVYIAHVNTGSSAPAASAYALYAQLQPLAQSIVISSLTTTTPTNQTVTGVTLVHEGNYPNGLPIATITGGGGSGATVKVVGTRIFIKPDTLFWIVTGVVVLTGGRGYSSTPNVVFSAAGVGGSAATATAALGTIPGPSGLTGCAPVPINPNAPGVFIGQGGTRYMIVLRQNLNESLSPVDPNSPIAVNLLGEYVATIISILRDSSGNVTATVSDITGFAIGAEVLIQGCTTDSTFNGAWTLTNVQSTLTPNGILQWVDTGDMSASNDNTGVAIAPAGPAPVAFLPPGGPNAQQYIAAFTVAAPQDGQPVQLQDGPYTYIPSSDPTAPFSTSILSMQGPLTLVLNAETLARSAGGVVAVTLADIEGIVPGSFVQVSDATDDTLDGNFVVAGVQATTGTAGVVSWLQADTTASAGVTANLSFQAGLSGQAQATLQSTTGLAAGDVVNIEGALPAAFNGQATLASVLGNVVTFPTAATGAATLEGATMTLLQDLPTTSCAVASAITSIIRDYAGNVTAQVPALEGWAAGQIATIAGVTDGSFDGSIELVSATLNQDGITASLAWTQVGQPASVSVGGTISSVPDMICNFDDNFLSNGEDVTAQLTAIPPPTCSDVYFSETLNRVIYTKGNDTQHYFSNIDDAENIDSDGGILAVAASNGATTVCVREMENGEVLSLKQNAGYAILQNSLTPNQWEIVRRWKDRGPVSARAVDVGPDFMIIFVEYTGAYRYYKGELTWIGQEKQGTWDRVNWAAKDTICVAIDDDNKVVHFALPLDGATSPNKDVSCNYFNGWQDPLILNMMGQVIPNRYGRRWDEADLTALSMKVCRRSINLNGLVNDKQLLFGRSDQGVNTVFVDTFEPGVYSDDGNTRSGSGWLQLGIDWQYQPAFDQSPTCDVLRMAKCKGQMLGSGVINFEAITNDPTVEVPPIEFIPPSSTVAKNFSLGLRLGEDCAVVGLNINNGAQVGVWAQLHKLIIGGNEEYPSEPTQ